MKGKTNQPLTILIDTSMAEEPEVKSLLEAGHILSYIRPIAEYTYDLILSRKAWRYDPKYVDLAIKAARKSKKEVKV